MGTTSTRRATANHQHHHNASGLQGRPGTFYDRSLDRELAELERRGLARFHEGGTVAITARGLEALNGRHQRGRR